MVDVTKKPEFDKWTREETEEYFRLLMEHPDQKAHGRLCELLNEAITDEAIKESPMFLLFASVIREAIADFRVGQESDDLFTYFWRWHEDYLKLLRQYQRHHDEYMARCAITDEFLSREIKHGYRLRFCDEMAKKYAKYKVKASTIRRWITPLEIEKLQKHRELQRTFNAPRSV